MDFVDDFQPADNEFKNELQNGGENKRYKQKPTFSR